MTVRKASHAGSWYTDDGEQLDSELESWLGAVPATVDTLVTEEVEPAPLPMSGVRAIIGPHAGLSYSGATAAYAYKSINTSGIKRVFILGPSHHVYMRRCAFSQCTEYETPLGNIQVDRKAISELQRKGRGAWESMGLEVDEDEHSLEMHLPFIYKIFEHRIDDIKLVPILVGNLSFDREQAFGALLAEYLEDEENLFVVSSDFCHWGSRFRFTWYKESEDTGAVQLGGKRAGSRETPIWKSIERLDYDGMRAITRLDHVEFKQYLDQTENTICGRHPIGVLLGAVSHLFPEHPGNADNGPQLRFVKYAQSSKVQEASDSSVTVTSPTSEKPQRKPSSRGTSDELLSAAERENLVNEAEWGFRKWLTENGPSTGYVMYPSTRQILKSLQSLYVTLEEIDFSDIALK
ncbi:hypothetical protein GGH94_002900 [Coemansia aciculifera]|uniref:Uncharacterized protein n=2 Tax=Coemansia TaxID=4863 RepID=A0A9W8IIU7_9FUNG|nr:hypothetical protein GGH94_002900 [Coemansia aciculifera]